jgi:hypothetical protein
MSPNSDVGRIDVAGTMIGTITDDDDDDGGDDDNGVGMVELFITNEFAIACCSSLSLSVSLSLSDSDASSDGGEPLPVASMLAIDLLLL